jgi:hypothetical protein
MEKPPGTHNHRYKSGAENWKSRNSHHLKDNAFFEPQTEYPNGYRAYYQNEQSARYKN